MTQPGPYRVGTATDPAFNPATARLVPAAPTGPVVRTLHHVLTATNGNTYAAPARLYIAAASTYGQEDCWECGQDISAGAQAIEVEDDGAHVDYHLACALVPTATVVRQWLTYLSGVEAAAFTA